MKTSPVSGSASHPFWEWGSRLEYPALAVACLLVAAALPQSVPVRGDLLPAEVVGSWSTSAELAGTLRTGRYPEADPEDWQPLLLSVAGDGVVTGALGGARLIHARLEVEQGWIGRWLHRGHAYVIRGELAGPVTRQDAGEARRFMLPCRLEAGALQGVLTLLPRHPLTRPLILQKSPAAVALRRP